MYDFEDLITPVSSSEILDSFYDTLSILGVNTTSWKPGGVTRAFLVSSAIVMSGFSQLIALIVRSGWLELSEGPWLTLVAWFKFRVKRQEATFATGAGLLSNTGGGVYTFDPGDLVFRNVATNQEYRNTQTVSIGPGDDVSITIRCTREGSIGDADPNTVTELVTSFLGLTFTNPLRFSGQDEETDPELRARCYEKLGSLSSMGPRDAYSYAAKSARRPDGSRIGVTRTRGYKDGYGNVWFLVATASGEVTGSHDDRETDLGIVHNELAEKALPEFITLLPTMSATASQVSFTYSLWVYDDIGMTDAELEDAISAKLKSLVSSLPIGGVVLYPDAGKLFLSAAKVVMGSVHTGIVRIVIHTPSADPEFARTAVPVFGTATATAINRLKREQFHELVA